MGINQKETEVKYLEGEKMALENLCLTGEQGIVKGEPKVRNQNEPRSWRARRMFHPCSSEGIRLKHLEPLGPCVELKLLPPTEPVLLFDSIFLLMYALTCI